MRLAVNDSPRCTIGHSHGNAVARGDIGLCCACIGGYCANRDLKEATATRSTVGVSGHDR